MTKIEANVPDYLAKQAFAAAERAKVPVDQIIAMALSAQLAAWKGTDDMATRANLADFDALLDKVPDVPPLPGDELPEGYKPAR